MVHSHTVKRLSIIFVVLLVGCQTPLPDISKATVTYPYQLHSSTVLPIQVTRDQEYMTVVNSTARNYNSATLWINQQYTCPLPAMPAGSTVRLNLWDCYDSLGEQFNAGGIWRTDDPTKLIIAEMQQAEDQPLVGFIVIGED